MAQAVSQGQAPPERCERSGMNPLNPKFCKRGGGVCEAWHKRFLRRKLHLNAASAVVGTASTRREQVDATSRSALDALASTTIAPGAAFAGGGSSSSSTAARSACASASSGGLARRRHRRGVALGSQGRRTLRHR